MTITESCNEREPQLQSMGVASPGSFSERSEGWESDDSYVSVLSSIASFDLDKALQELELDQRVPLSSEHATPAGQRLSSVYFTPAATFGDLPTEVQSPVGHQLCLFTEAAHTSPDGLACHHALLEKMSSQVHS